MTQIDIKSLESKTQINSFEPLSYIQIEQDIIEKSNYVAFMLMDQRDAYEMSDDEFSDLIDENLQIHGFNSDNIKGIEYKDHKLNIHTNDGHVLTIDIQEKSSEIQTLDKYQEQLLGGVNLKSAILKETVLSQAIRSVFLDHEGVLWNGEIDEQDRFDTKIFLELLQDGKIEGLGGYKKREIEAVITELKLEGLTLKELRQTWVLQHEKLIQVYDIQGQTDRSLSILQQQLSYFTGIGDLYEGGARLFGLTTDEIASRVDNISHRMDTDQLIEYIRTTNIVLDENGKVSDMANNQNQLVIRLLAQNTFKKLKFESAPKRKYIDFIHAITGRDIVDQDGNKLKDVEVASDLAQVEVANKALIHLMYIPEGVIGQLTEKHKKEIVLEDDELDGVSPAQAMQNSFALFTGLLQIDALAMFDSMGASHLLTLPKDTQYSDLSFNDMILLGTIHRITQGFIENKSELSQMTAEQQAVFIENQNKDALKDAFSTLNDSFSESFDASWLDWDGMDGDDLGLEGEFEEIFDLYQDINGGGVFDLADDNMLNRDILTLSTGLVVAVGIITAMVVLSPALLAGGTFGAIAIAGAKIGVATTIASQLTSRKGYDTAGEAALGISTQAATDIIFSAVFTAGAATAIRSIFGQSFTNTLQAELQAGKLSDSTIKVLEKVFKEGNDYLLKNSNYLVSKSIEQIRYSLTHRPSMSPVVTQYIGRHSFVNGGMGTAIDIGIGVGDGLGAGIVYALFEAGFIKPYFNENHYNPDQGETLAGVKDKKVKQET